MTVKSWRGEDSGDIKISVFRDVVEKQRFILKPLSGANRLQVLDNQ